MKNKKTSALLSSGFTLVETVLALLAIGIGLVGLFGLGRLAMESSREAENDRRCARMADTIFETLRTVNTIYINEARTNGFNNNPASDVWNILWDQGKQGQRPQLPETLPNMLWHPDDGYLLFPHIAGMTTNEIPLLYNEDSSSPTRAYHPDHISLANWNPLYQLFIGYLDKYYYPFNDEMRIGSPITDANNILKVTLYIYPDGLSSSSDVRIFTTTLSNSGGMQARFEPALRVDNDADTSSSGGGP